MSDAYSFYYRLIPSDKRDKNGKWAETGFRGKMNHLKRWLRYQIAKRQYEGRK